MHEVTTPIEIVLDGDPTYSELQSQVTDMAEREVQYIDIICDQYDEIEEAKKRLEDLEALVHDAKFSKPDNVQVLRINNELTLILSTKELVATSLTTEDDAALKGGNDG